MPNYTKGTPHNTPPSRKGDITHLHSHESRFKSKGGPHGNSKGGHLNIPPTRGMGKK